MNKSLENPCFLNWKNSLLNTNFGPGRVDAT